MTTAHRSPNFPHGFPLHRTPRSVNSWHPVFSSGSLQQFSSPSTLHTQHLQLFQEPLIWLAARFTFDWMCLFPFAYLVSFMRCFLPFLYFSGFGSMFSPASVADPDEEKQHVGGSQPGLSSMETFWGRRALTRACADTVRDRPGGSPALFQGSLQPSFTPPCLEDTQLCLGGLCLTDLEGRWLTLSPGQRRGSGWSRSHCPESCLWPQEMPTWKSPSPSWVWDSERDSSFSSRCVSTAPRVWGTSHRRSTELGSRDPQALAHANVRGRAQAWRKKTCLWGLWSLGAQEPWG